VDDSGACTIVTVDPVFRSRVELLDTARGAAPRTPHVESIAYNPPSPDRMIFDAATRGTRVWRHDVALPGGTYYLVARPDDHRIPFETRALDLAKGRGTQRVLTEWRAWQFTLPENPDQKVRDWFGFTGVRLLPQGATSATYPLASSRLRGRFHVAFRLFEADSLAIISGEHLEVEFVNDRYTVTAEGGGGRGVQVAIVSPSLFPVPHETRFLPGSPSAKGDGGGTVIPAYGLVSGSARAASTRWRPLQRLDAALRTLWSQGVSGQEIASFRYVDDSASHVGAVVMHPALGSGVVESVNKKGDRAHVAFWTGLWRVNLDEEPDELETVPTVRPMSVVWRSPSI
jgi:hypothetical protein